MKNYTRFSQVQSDLIAGNTTCQEIVAYYLKQIEANKHLNAFINVYTDDAMELAKLIDAKIANNTAGKLAGMVIGVKDAICQKGKGIQASSKMLEGYISPYTATALQKLLDEDAIVIGNLSCDEFAMGSTNEFSTYGPVLNAADNSKVPGGSSGGSAVAVQAGLCHASLGSDTGGSVRQPAAFTGTYGFKPSYGRISRYGLIAYASSFDQIGTFTNSVEDAALLFEVMGGNDSMDATSSGKPMPALSNLEYGKKATIGICKDVMEHEALSPEVKKAAEAFIENLKSDGHTIEEFSFSLLDQMVPTYYVITTAEASSNLARYDGVRYGYRSENPENLEELYKASRSEGFGEEVKRRIMLGTFVLSSGYYDAYFTRAQKVRRLITERTSDLFKQFDFIISPTTPTTAFDIGRKNADPTEAYLADLFTVQANLAGIPGISIPFAKSAQNLPIGMQVMAPKYNEAELLAFAASISIVNA